eukprot:TRINITY_DN3641_c0_g1_i1.p1 TRINITY_DN3641_c0_g1~~TRINITY_DN3641_c0_g1_i1.p1  ORF type:complete len:308 (+),score=68.21 TRINITY_DN3641_c0_g1_i1:64-987(+)
MCIRDRFKFKDALQDVFREVAIMRKINHPNVIKLYEFVDDFENDQIYIILEYAEGGQIIEWDADSGEFYPLITEGFISEDELRSIFYGCIQGLAYLHQNQIIHRDIKPQNILLGANKVPKISDFGASIAKEESNDNLTGTLGTMQFLAPEILNSENKQGYSGKAADVWALSATFFCFVFYRLPYWNENMMELFRMIETEDIKWPKNRVISDDLRDFLEKGLTKDPTKRIGLFDMLEHPFLKEFAANQRKLSANDRVISVSQDEVRNALKPLTTIILCKFLANKLKHCLLYTSPSPRDRQKSRMPSSA